MSIWNKIYLNGLTCGLFWMEVVAWCVGLSVYMKNMNYNSLYLQMYWIYKPRNFLILGGWVPSFWDQYVRTYLSWMNLLLCTGLFSWRHVNFLYTLYNINNNENNRKKTSCHFSLLCLSYLNILKWDNT